MRLPLQKKTSFLRAWIVGCCLVTSVTFATLAVYISVQPVVWMIPTVMSIATLLASSTAWWIFPAADECPLCNGTGHFHPQNDDEAQ